MNKGTYEFWIERHLFLARCKTLLFDGGAEYANFFHY